MDRVVTLWKKLTQYGWLWAIMVWAIMLVVYVRTLLPGVVGGDAGEQQYAGHILALTHPTGTPLYIFVSYIWTHLVQIGSVAYRMNLLAAASASLACGLMTWFVHRIYGRWSVAVAAGLVCGLGATFWGQAVIADKYAFNTIWVVLVVGLTLLWVQERENPYGNYLLYGLSFAYGLSLLHHRTMLLFAFGFLWLMVYTLRMELWRQKKRSMICLLLVLLPPLIVYPLFLPWAQSRDLSPSDWQPQTAGEWVQWLMDRHEAKEAFVIEGFDAQLEYYIETTLNDYTLIIVILALVGVVLWLRYSPGIAGFILSSYALQGALAANWRDNDTLFTYFLPSFILIVFAAAHGLSRIWDYIQAQLEARPVLARWQPVVGGLGMVIVLILPAYQFNHTYELRRLESIYGYSLVGEQTKAGVSTGKWRTTLKAADMGERLTTGMDNLPPDAVLISDWEQVTIFWYYQKVEDRRPDLEIVYPVEKLRDYEDDPRPLCISRTINISELTDQPMADWHPNAHDALTCLYREAQTAIPENMTSVGRILTLPGSEEPLIELTGYQVDSTVYEAGQFAPVTLVWRALADLDEDYAISLRVLDEQWNPVAAWDTRHPVTGMYPTGYWESGEVVRDYHEIDIPRDMPPGNYIWGVIVYRLPAEGGYQNLRSGEDEFIFAGTFEVIPDN